MIDVKSRPGNNRLRFSGAGKVDGKGATFTHVTLWLNKKNYIVNSALNQPRVGKTPKVFESIPGWQGGPFELGSGLAYNSAWNVPYRRVCNLDTNKNVNVYQDIKL